MTNYLTISREQHLEIGKTLTLALDLLDKLVIQSGVHAPGESLFDEILKVRNLIGKANYDLACIDPNF